MFVKGEWCLIIDRSLRLPSRDGGHITAAAQDEGGNGQDGPPEAVGEPGADRAGGALGGQAGQPAPGGCGLPDWASLA